jgi:glycerol 3-phosphatase-2
VGDRLDTDIEGAHAVGVDSLLVMTGVTHLAELVAAGPDLRPSYVSPDLEGLFEPHPVPERDERGAHLGGWRATTDQGVLQVEGAGSDADWWRVVAVAGWAALDATGSAIDVTSLRPPVTVEPSAEVASRP